MMHNKTKAWFKSGTPWIWLNAGAISIALVAVFGLLLLILFRGMSHFWPANVEAFHFENNQNAITIIAEVVESETVPVATLHNIENTHGDAHGNVTRYLVKTGNRDILGSDFRWIYDIDLIKREQPENIMVLERIEWGNFYGYLDSVYQNDKDGKPQLVASGEQAWSAFLERLHRTNEIRYYIWKKVTSVASITNWNACV